MSCQEENGAVVKAKAAWESAKAHFIKTGDGFYETLARESVYRRLLDEHNKPQGLQAVQKAGPAGSDVERVWPKGTRLR